MQSSSAPTKQPTTYFIRTGDPENDDEKYGTESVFCVYTELTGRLSVQFGNTRNDPIIKVNLSEHIILLRSHTDQTIVGLTMENIDRKGFLVPNEDDPETCGSYFQRLSHRGFLDISHIPNIIWKEMGPMKITFIPRR